MSKLLRTLFLKSTSLADRISCTSVLRCPSNNCHQIRVCHTGEERMASCDVLALFTTPKQSSIKDFTSTFDGSYERCDQKDQPHSFEGKKSPALPNFDQRNGSATCGTFVLYQSPFALERQTPLSVYELKNKVEIFFQENKNKLLV